MAITEDKTNREEVLAMDGVQVISGIISHILGLPEESNWTKNDDTQDLDGVDQIPVHQSPNKAESDHESDKKVDKEFSLSELSELEPESTIDRIDAKTLNLCVESIATLLNEDIKSFMQLPLESRIKIFRQMSQLLDVSFKLFPLLE